MVLILTRYLNIQNINFYFQNIPFVGLIRMYAVLILGCRLPSHCIDKVFLNLAKWNLFCDGINLGGHDQQRGQMRGGGAIRT